MLTLKRLIKIHAKPQDHKQAIHYYQYFVDDTYEVRAYFKPNEVYVIKFKSEDAANRFPAKIYGQYTMHANNDGVSYNITIRTQSNCYMSVDCGKNEKIADRLVRSLRKQALLNADKLAGNDNVNCNKENK